jgi:hypothetical protein
MKKHIIMFIIMVIVGMLFNPMNMLANKMDDLYISLTLFYGGLLMASNMMWSHEIVHYLYMGHFNKSVFFIGIVLTLISIYLLRSQFLVNDVNWLKRMIPHHSTALTTTKELIKNNKNIRENTKLYRLAKSIIYSQEREIIIMKLLL